MRTNASPVCLSHSTPVDSVLYYWAMRVLALALFLATFGPVAQGQNTGMIPRWQVEELAQGIVRNVDSAKTVLVALRPGEWVQEGAPEVYVEQLAALLGEMQQLQFSAMALGRDPESVGHAVDTYIWLDRVDSLMASLTAGVRRYYNGAVADLLDSARNKNRDGIATTMAYMRQVAAYTEDELRVAHGEAQRCREEIVNRPRATGQSE